MNACVKEVRPQGSEFSFLVSEHSHGQCRLLQDSYWITPTEHTFGHVCSDSFYIHFNFCQSHMLTYSNEDFKRILKYFVFVERILEYMKLLLNPCITHEDLESG